MPRLPRPPESREARFIGEVACMEHDWEELGTMQKKLYGVMKWPVFPKSPVRARSKPELSIVGLSMIPAELAQRICKLFAMDYCCLQLPLPPSCSMDCEAEMQRLEEEEATIQEEAKSKATTTVLPK